MSDLYKALCTKTHSNYTKGQLYRYDYNCLGELKIYYGSWGCDYYNPKKGDLKCDLNNFVIFTDTLEIIYYKKRFKIFINLMNKLHLSIEPYSKSSKTYNIKNLLNTDCEKLFDTFILSIIAPMIEIQDSKLFIYHQEKLHYIISIILQVMKMKESVDANLEIKKCAEIVKEIYDIVKEQEDKAEKIHKNQSNENYQLFLKKQSELFEQWNTELNEFWNEEMK